LAGVVNAHAKEVRMKTIMTMLLVGFAAAGLAGLSGCIVHGHGDGGGGVEVIIPVAHVHTDHCGHYYYRDRWYVYNGHHHGPGCGHVYFGGRWTVRM
jgi:hypothetical protein